MENTEKIKKKFYIIKFKIEICTLVNIYIKIYIKIYQ